MMFCIRNMIIASKLICLLGLLSTLIMAQERTNPRVAIHPEEVKDLSKYARESALDDIGKAKVKEALPSLIKALSDKEPDVRKSAADAIMRIGPYAKDAIPALIKALTDKESEIRRTAADALFTMREEARAAIPSLISLLNDREREVRSSAADTLGSIGPEAKQAVPVLISLLKDNHHDVRKSSAFALGKIGLPAVPALLESLKQENKLVRSYAADAWGLLVHNQMRSYQPS